MPEQKLRATCVTNGSDLKAARARQILRRSEIMKGLGARTESWPEFQGICRAIVALDNNLGQGVRFLQTQKLSAMTERATLNLRLAIDEITLALAQPGEETKLAIEIVDKALGAT